MCVHMTFMYVCVYTTGPQVVRCIQVQMQVYYTSFKNIINYWGSHIPVNIHTCVLHIHVHIYILHYIHVSYMTCMCVYIHVLTYIHVHILHICTYMYTHTCGECQCRMTSTICPLNLNFEIYQKKIILPPPKIANHTIMPLYCVDS